VTNPDMGAILRNMKLPERMSGSQELRNDLISYVERGDSEPDAEEQHKLNWLLFYSAPRGPERPRRAGRTDLLGSVQQVPDRAEEVPQARNMVLTGSAPVAPGVAA
jgi:hypothetical protein